jgi:methylenetetrahydrofolate reductase (NADPH)
VRLPLSFEFFPTKTPEGAVKLRAVRQQLYARKPQFCSVTYGAGGSTHQGTFGAVQEILNEGVDAASHFSCIGATKATVREQLAELKAMGVKRLVALRGDLPSGYGIGGEFHYASDLVAFIREETGSDFHIEVACYPEVHPQARSPEADLQAFAAKVKAGADSAITQYFFSPEAYFRFVDDVRKLGHRHADRAGHHAHHQLDAADALLGRLRRRDSALDPPAAAGLRRRHASIKAFGLDVVTDLCARLRDGGAPAIHFYTMNQSAATLALLERLD